MRMISIQELTKETGVTVRTLRYYDQIGLLKPSGKTDGGHRLYSEVDVIRLQQILFLKEMGFSLKEIMNMLVTDLYSLKESLERQLKFVQGEQQKFERMEKMLQAVIYSTELEGEVNWNVMFELIQLSKQSPRIRERFQQQVFSEEEKKLLEKLPNMSEDNESVQEWIKLLKQLRGYMEEGKKPSHDDVQEATNQLMVKCLAMADGDEAFLDKLWEVRKSKEGSQNMNMYPMEEEFFAYMDEAFRIYDERERGK
ncbi:MerR family transcriptional regulator [Bacillus cytotoxicus]|uniref:MerR family transcriptional regulator n=1 Tax=Bacillus cytotoxicus TaxID=580165 RepID=UPI000661590B|nr:MerR family transcriptional regulator [Bacillus cytotoxicus]AWC30484.1 MerR family transcriptional regulator [Bacillus cytotoxicus]AWC34534.1 MerR family transcriptional regulator [Bacillus cytotoxicus]AWC38531.1 MerR family transcriptional regulator [Bacillus cytotoxicus]AWC42626.1 MerR family transcriptional regulator [Bacillus cytotoxicus]AWC46509.1 MerR family transcriptional regulator [Bacillus cytotoxicus]